jgi:hypothetical protein
MPVVTFHHLSSGTLFPGDSHHWVWNNAGREKVWAFSLDAEVPLMFAFPGAQARVEITRVEYRQNFNGPGSGDTEQEVHRWVKNTGSVPANYFMHMAVIRE